VNAVNTIIEEYRARTPESERLYREWARWLPGGDTRTSSYYTPYPVVMAGGSGCQLVDVDDNRYLDFFNNSLSLIHGHAHPAIVAALAEQASRGTALGAPSPIQAEHAEIICRRVPSIEKIRYCNSGTEATLFASRAARAFTGKEVIVKIDGGYHGTHDLAEINMFPGSDGRPADRLPIGYPRLRVPPGVPAGTLDSVIVVPFNDTESMAYVLERFHGDIAAVLMEPALYSGGAIAPLRDYLHEVRQLCTRRGVLLIFDEVATFRLGPMQVATGIEPDLTALGKIIGGGLPIGAFGGRDEIMMQFDPAGARPLFHAGTFAANEATMAAGVAALNHFGPKEVTRLNSLGESLLAGLQEAANRAAVKMTVSGLGSFGTIHWGDGPLNTAEDSHRHAQGVGDLPTLLHLELLNRGIYLSRRGTFCLSTPMTEEHVTQFLNEFSATLEKLSTYVSRNMPELWRDEALV